MKNHNITQHQAYELFNISNNLLFKQDYQEVVINYTLTQDGEHVRDHIIGKCLPKDELKAMKLSTFIIDHLPYDKLKYLTNININPIKKSITYYVDYPID